MSPDQPHPLASPSTTRAGIALSFVTAHTAAEAERAAATALGRSPGRSTEPFGADEFGRELELPELAERILDSCTEAIAGALPAGSHSIVAVDPEVDVLELALLTEHLAAAPCRRPVVINEVVAVTSVAAVLALLFDAPLPGFALAAEDAVEFDIGARRLAERIEFASLVVLDGLLEAPAEATRRATGLIRTLAPRARILRPDELAAVLDSPRTLRRGRAHELARTMGWQCSLADLPQPKDTGLDSLVFRDPRPLHPARFARALEHDLAPGAAGRVLRGRGFVRLATRPDAIGACSIAGQVVSLDPTGMPAWSSGAPFGQELVIVGEGLDESAVVELLSDCLLDDEELLAGPAAWECFADPFPAWVGPLD